MYIGAEAVEAMQNFKLLITFENGEQRIFDVGPYLEMGIFRELKNPAFFNLARVAFDTVEWPNGADICPETLCQDSVTKEKH